MTLKRSDVTAASRVMLPAYVALFGYLGVNYTFTAEGQLTTSPTLSWIDHVLTLRAWGVMFLGTAGILAASLLGRSRDAARYALWLGIVCMGVWSGLFTAAWIYGDAPPTAFAWPAFVGVACFASNRSLRRGETGRG